MRVSGLEVISHSAVGTRAGPSIILVHGAWHAAWCWDEGFAARLAAHGHDVHAVSLRGHGHSEGRRSLWRVRIRDHVADLRRVIDAVGGPVLLVGHSRGAYVVQKHLETAAAAGAVLLAPMPHFGVAPCMGRLLRRVPGAVARIHASFGALSIAATPAMARALFFSARMPEEAVRRHQARLQGEAFLAYLDLHGLDLCRPRWRASPMLVLAAGADALFTRREMEEVAAAHGAGLEFVPGMAHDMMLEPGWETVADRIAAWAQTIGARREEPRSGDIVRWANEPVGGVEQAEALS
ncbi:alpha/beta hydrolase [Methylorubrum extorquens]|uniref:Alpha/beta hydrolase fold protein n=1 Tax=Methylorubrum extorquens (strain CM4 / NCIMB 13688) TaxID=440085 RepID=B7KY12_METC4|nr:alpha/beta fold hydrolase [Methylorubrum extorquens]ACK81175.1 alpha/beta hydrolase fold protein [Methylorubrum extorquens CM4]